MRHLKPSYCNIYLFRILLIALIFLFCFIYAGCGKYRPDPLSEAGPQSHAEGAIDINSASAEDLEKLPAIGEETAKKIVEFRERYGKFRKAEHILLVPKMSDNKFERIKEMISAK